jgi:molecular chaperone GrpE
VANDEQNPVEDALEEDQVTLESQTEPEAEAGDADSNEASEKIEALEAELQAAKEQALRAAAEAQNARRRAEQDVEKAHKFGLEKFVGDMLPVVDNLERALQAGAEEGESVDREGVELTLKSLVDALGRHKVESVDPEGEPFDPQVHQAMTMIESPDVEPNTVVNVIQKGYILNGRSVRPAMVVVSKAAQ